MHLLLLIAIVENVVTTGLLAKFVLLSSYENSIKQQVSIIVFTFMNAL